MRRVWEEAKMRKSAPPPPHLFHLLILALIAAALPGAGGVRRLDRCPKQQSCPPPATEPTCPCVKPRGSNTCFNYDARLQAPTMLDAIHTFPDTTDFSAHANPLVAPNKADVLKAPTGAAAAAAAPMPVNHMQAQGFAVPMAAPAAPGYGAPPDAASIDVTQEFGCNTAECRACLYHVNQGFVQALNGSNEANVHEDLSQAVNQLLGGQVPHSKCSYLEQKNQKKPPAPQGPNDNPVVDQMVNLLQQAGQSRFKRDLFDNLVDPDVPRPSMPDDSDELKEKLLGLSTKISCDYVRGQALTTNSPWCGLCNICWTWRKLPPEYFPAYLNEVSCDSDTACLAGFGKCRPVLRTLTVLKNTAPSGSPEAWEQQSINSVAACECQVEAGTPLHSFITR